MLDLVGLEDLDSFLRLFYALLSEPDVLGDAQEIGLPLLQALLVAVHALVDGGCPVLGFLRTL